MSSLHKGMMVEVPLTQMACDISAELADCINGQSWTNWFNRTIRAQKRET